MLIPSAGPASPVRGVRHELLRGSSFFLPGPSPLWPSGRNGKTSLVNYLRVEAASATCHTAGLESVCVCVMCVSGSATWQRRNVCRGCMWAARLHVCWETLDPITSQEHTLSDHFSCWVQFTRVALRLRVSEHAVPHDFVKRKQSCWTRWFSARLWNRPHELFRVAQPPCTKMHFSLATNVVYIETCRPPALPLTNQIGVRPFLLNNTFLC